MLGSPLGYLVAVGEFFGGVGLVFGFLSRFSAAALVVIMLGAIVKVHGANGFFLDKHGFEYNLSLIGNLAANAPLRSRPILHRPILPSQIIPHRQTDRRP